MTDAIKASPSEQGKWRCNQLAPKVNSHVHAKMTVLMSVVAERCGRLPATNLPRLQKCVLMETTAPGFTE
jgi:hypothetical protein